MKRILNLPMLALLFVSTLFLISCEEEPGGGTGGGGGGGTTDDAPSITLLSASELTLTPGEEFTIEFSATKGTNDMNGVTVYEDGIKVPVERLKFNGVDASANAALLVGTDRESLSWTATIVAQSTAGTSSNFDVEIADDMSLTSAVTVTVTTAASPPTLTGAAPMTFEIVEGSKNGFKLTGTKGTGQLTSIEVRQNSELVDPANLEWEGVNMMSMGNPFALTGTELDGFEDVSLFVTLPMEVGSFVYTFILEDEFGSRDSTSYNVTTTISGTPIEMREDVLLNAAGPQGTGGLDLDTGESTGTGSVSGAEAEIIDNGINNDLTADVNWIQTISCINGATMKYVVAAADGIPEGFTFEGVQVKEELEGLFTANTGGIIDDSNSSSIVQPGDTFIVQKGTQYWLITAKEVNVRGDEGDNSDNYVFDVKF